MQAGPRLDRRHLRFGVFELDTAIGELRKHGVRVRLQDQPLKLLLCLLETPGEVCTREALIHGIWPEGTFVDYERGLNSAATRLRQVMGDSADAPRYIETVGRKGYRFIAPVEEVSNPEKGAQAAETEGKPPAPLQSPLTERLTRSERRMNRPLWPYAVVLGAGLALGVVVGAWHARQLVTNPLMRLSIDLEPEMVPAGKGPGVALARDGTILALTVRCQDGKIRLATRRLDQSHFTLLPGTDGASSPFFSPDGQWVAFFSDDKLKKIAVQGGVPVALADASTFTRGPRARFPAGSWGDDGSIIAMLNPAAGLMRLPAAGGSPVPLTGLKRADGEVDTWPQVLPGSRAILFTRHTGDYDSANVDVLSLKTGEHKTIVSGALFGRYLRAGYLVYIRRNALFAVPFDPSRLDASGTPQEVLEDINSRIADWGFDFSDTGSFTYLTHEPEPQRSLFWTDTSGRILPVLKGGDSSDVNPRISPDGGRLAFSRSIRGRQDIWILDIDRGAATRVTALPGVNDSPVWTPDASYVVFRSVDQPNPGIYAVRSDGSGEPRRLLDLNNGEFPSSVSPDGKHLVLWAGGRVWVSPLQKNGRDLSAGKPALFLETRFNPIVPGRMAPAFSPDGRWLAYCSNDSEQLEVYVVPFPGPGGKWRISTAGGVFPAWSRSRHELFFQDLESHRVMVATYRTSGDSFVAENPHVWSDTRLLELGLHQSYDIMPDGKRSAVVLYSDGTSEWKRTTKVAFLLNFFDELRRRVRAGGN